MHKKDIIKQVADKLNLSGRETTEVINAFFDTFIDALIENERLELRGIGVFEIKQRKPKTVRHISTGELIQTKSYKDVEYKTSKTIKDRLNPTPPLPKRKLKKLVKKKKYSLDELLEGITPENYRGEEDFGEAVSKEVP